MIKGKRVLDIGAGDDPDKRATDAIDIDESEYMRRKAKEKSPKLKTYLHGDFKSPPKEKKGEYDAVVSHFSPVLTEKSASKALDFVTKDGAIAEVETELKDATKIVQTLHDANFKVSSVELKTKPAVVPALGGLSGNVVIKARKVKSVRDTYPLPIKIQMPLAKWCNKKCKPKRSYRISSLSRVGRL